MVDGIGRADENDVGEMEALYDELNDFLAASVNYPGWRKGLYPTRDTAAKGIAQRSLFVLRKQGLIEGSIILDHQPEAAYSQVRWGVDCGYDEIFVVRTLAVRPSRMRRGVSGKLMDFAREHAVQNGMRALRLDVSVDNTPAIALYERQGYRYRGTVDLGLNIPWLVWFRLYELPLRS